MAGGATNTGQTGWNNIGVEMNALWERARQFDAPAGQFVTNAHVHLPPNFSAFDSVAQAVRLASEENLTALGASNYYDYKVYKEFAQQAEAQRLFPLFGLEIITLIEDLAAAGVKINDPGNPGKMYVCGTGITAFDPMNAEASDLLAVIRERDSERMEQMAVRLAELFADSGLDTRLTTDAIRADIAARYGCEADTVYLQERHLARAFQEAVFETISADERPAFWSRLFGTASRVAADDAVGIQNEIRSYLMKAGKAAYVPETFVGFDHARRLILALGGIPCYPTLLDGANPICPFEAPVDEFIGRLKTYGFTCAELIPLRNRPEILTEYVLALRRAGIVVTAGTEHNTPDLVPLAPICLGGVPIPDDVAAVFEEGTCVVIAHQYLVANGQTGFVDGEGRPNPAFATDEDRIGAFRRLGALILNTYRSRTGA